jgi:hypothetical protein
MKGWFTLLTISSSSEGVKVFVGILKDWALACYMYSKWDIYMYAVRGVQRRGIHG